MIYGNKFLLLENSIINLQINNPKELSKYMKSNISYKNFTKLMTAQEVYASKKGSCHDQVQFEDYFFRKFKLKYGKLFSIEYNDGEESGGRTHSFIWYIDNNKYYWFENSWKTYSGINGPYESLSDLKKDFIEKDLKESNKYSKIMIRTVKNIKPGMTLNEYVNNCLGGN